MTCLCPSTRNGSWVERRLSRPSLLHPPRQRLEHKETATEAAARLQADALGRLIQAKAASRAD